MSSKTKTKEIVIGEEGRANVYDRRAKSACIPAANAAVWSWGLSVECHYSHGLEN